MLDIFAPYREAFPDWTKGADFSISRRLWPIEHVIGPSPQINAVRPL
jgi:hypothetical protein